MSQSHKMSQCVITQLPILDRLAKSSPRERKKILEGANLKLIKSIVECVENVLKGNVRLKKNYLKKLKKYKSILRRINSVGHKLAQKKKVIIQTGGAFLPALLSPIIGLLVDHLVNG